MDRYGGPLYPYHRCRNCGLTALARVQEGEEGQPGSDPIYGGAQPRGGWLVGGLMMALECARLRRLARYGALRTGADLLDVGSGKGRFVLCARSRGFDALGIDPYAPIQPSFPKGSNWLVKDHLRPGLWPAESFDAITFWHALEHMGDPNRALESAWEWLRPNGVLAIATPNTESWQARLGGPRWFHLDPPRHVCLFAPRTLAWALARAGFDDVQIVFPIVGLGYLGMVQTLASRLGGRPNLLYNYLKRNEHGYAPLSAGRYLELGLSATACLLLLLPLVLVSLCEVMAGRGGTMIALARKSTVKSQG
jgi:SAM-dependent methyltransferase